MSKSVLVKLSVLVVLAVFVSSCSTREWHTYKPLNIKQPTSTDAGDLDANRNDESLPAGDQGARQTKDIPVAPAIRHSSSVKTAGFNVEFPDKALMLNADGMPLPRFIDMALGELLELNYEIAPELASRQDPITLHVSKPVPAQRLFEMVQSTLELYKVSFVFNDAGGIRVVPTTSLRMATPTLDTQKELAASKLRLGRIIEFMPLNYIGGEEAAGFAKLFSNAESGDQINYVPSVNALMMIGSPESIPKMRDAIALIDRPALQSHSIRIIKPVFWSARGLMPIISSMLTAQGVPVRLSMAQSGAGVYMFPIDELNAIVVVSPQKTWLGSIQSIIAELDVPEAAGKGSQVYIYHLKNTRAQEIGAVVGQILGQSVSSGQSGIGAAAGSGVAPSVGASVSAPAADALKGLSVIIDDKNNALVFVGDANVYQGILPLIKSLDRTPKQVLLEVTIAEVSLNDTNALGIIWGSTGVGLGSTTIDIGTGASVADPDNSGNSTSTGGLALPSGGLGIVANNRNITAQLAALAGESRAKILSTPRLLVRDGEQANLVIGDQISVIKSEVTNSSSNNNLVRGFEFVETGVILDIAPTINEGGLVQLDLSQEVSTAGEAPAGGNPNINKRKIQTKMVARNGQTIAIGGMISHSLTSQKAKVPVLGDIPLLGALFSSRSNSDRTTELILLVTPYVVANADDASRLNEAMKEQLSWYDDLLSAPLDSEKTEGPKAQ